MHPAAVHPRMPKLLEPGHCPSLRTSTPRWTGLVLVLGSVASARPTAGELLPTPAMNTVAQTPHPQEGARRRLEKAEREKARAEGSLVIR